MSRSETAREEINKMTVVRTAVKDNGSGIKPSFTLGGKMEKMLGISTNAKLNPLCQKRHGCGMGCTICENCFAYGGHKPVSRIRQ